jgi:hypothetical protein
MQVSKTLIDQHGSPDKKAKKVEDEGWFVQLKCLCICSLLFVEEDGHANDPALKRTGKLCGGLLADIKRKLPWYASDYKDALNMQCLAR